MHIFVLYLVISLNLLLFMKVFVNVKLFKNTFVIFKLFDKSCSDCEHVDLFSGFFCCFFLGENLWEMIFGNLRM